MGYRAQRGFAIAIGICTRARDTRADHELVSERNVATVVSEPVAGGNQAALPPGPRLGKCGCAASSFGSPARFESSSVVST
jgi:hypothetical protein